MIGWDGHTLRPIRAEALLVWIRRRREWRGRAAGEARRCVTSPVLFVEAFVWLVGSSSDGTNRNPLGWALTMKLKVEVRMQPMWKYKHTATNPPAAFCVSAQLEKVSQEERRCLIASGRAPVKRTSQWLQDVEWQLSNRDPQCWHGLRLRRRRGLRNVNYSTWRRRSISWNWWWV